MSFNLNIKKTFNIVIGALISFMLLYRISFSFMPSLTTGRVAVLLLIFLCFKQLINGLILGATNGQKLLFLFLCTIFIYSLIQFMAYGFSDSTQMSRVFHLIVYAVLGGSLLASLYGFNINELILSLILALVAQSILIIFESLSTDFRGFIKSVLTMPVRSTIYESTSRWQGLTNGGGAQLSVTQSIGALLVYLTIIRRNLKFRGHVIYGIFLALIFLSIFLTGRTGMIGFAIFSIGFLFVASFRDKIRLAIVLIAITLFAGVGISLMAGSHSHYFSSIAKTADWQSELIRPTSSETISALAKMNVPPLSAETIVGTGTVSNSDGSNSSGSDLGYIQTYYALGLVATVLFYGLLLTFFVKELYFIRKKREGVLIYLGVIMMFFYEYKEPFIFKYNFCIVLLALTFAFIYQRRAQSSAISLKTTNEE